MLKNNVIFTLLSGGGGPLLFDVKQKCYGGAIGLIVACLEDEVDVASFGDRDKFFGAFERVLFALYDARAGDQRQRLAFPDRERSDPDLFHMRTPLVGCPVIIRGVHTSCKEAAEAGIVFSSSWTDSSVDRAPAF